MTDLEITKACAEAMELPVTLRGDAWYEGITTIGRLYNPLHDDAQAMALVKRFSIAVYTDVENLRGKWRAGNRLAVGIHGNLNHAICECVAEMQAAK